MSPTEIIAASVASARSDRRGRTRRTHRRGIVAACLIAGDLAAALAASSLFGLMGRTSPEGITGVVFGALPLPAPSVVIVFAALGLYLGYGPSPPERLRLRSWGVATYAACCLMIAAGGHLTLGLAGEIVAFSGVMILLGFYTEVAIRNRLIRRKIWGAPTAIIGADPLGQSLANSLLAQPELGFRPIGFIVEQDEEAPPRAPDDLPIIGRLAGDPIQPVEVAMFSSCADLARHDGSRIGRMPVSRVVLAQQIQDLQNMWVQIRPLGTAIGLEIRRELYRPLNLRLKRVIDGVLALLGLVLTAPLIGGLALAIRRLDPGNPFYVQVRVGRNGRAIKVLKLRSMYRDSDRRLREHLESSPEARAEWQRFFKLTNDPRVLPGIGHFIRSKSLDELPQLWNVINGDMSLVGPRPFPAYHMESFDPAFRTLRTSVPPGLTGLWQISSRSDGDLLVQRSQDTYYIHNWSPWLDLYILLATIPAAFGGRGAR